MAVIVTPSTVRSILLRGGFSAATPIPGSKKSFSRGGFVVRTFRRQGEEYPAHHGVSYYVDGAVEVRHAFGDQAQSVASEMECLAEYAVAIAAAGRKAQIWVYGEALGVKLTWRFVEVG